MYTMSVQKINQKRQRNRAVAAKTDMLKEIYLDLGYVSW